MMRSPAFRLAPFEIPNPNFSLTTVNEEDDGFFDEDSEQGSELGPLPISSPSAMHLKRALHHQQSSQRFEFNKAVSSPPVKANADDVLSLIIYGLVNVAVSVPCLYGYAGIIYRADEFQDEIADLTKLVILSSAVHQLVFSSKSTLTFAIAQVQDAGLIFLSSMASAIAKQSTDKEEAVSTAVIVLSLATALLGIVIYVVGKFRIASFVSLIPMPVVAGYLAFIGFFCLAAGMGLSCGKDVATWQDFAQLNEFRDWVLMTPAIVSGAVMTLVSRKSFQWWLLPLTITIIPILFYLTLFATGTSMEEARINGWVDKLEESKPFYNAFTHFNFYKVQWLMVPRLAITWLSMTLLVTFASALDVVAVEMDLGGQELDLDRELQTVGLSNIISGILGGYTGSYIFSMTIFTRRTGSETRWIGLFLAFFEIGLFCAPIDLMSYVPRFFFASTLIFIAFDLMAEWLLAVAFRVSGREYFVVLLTFLAITFLDDLVLGIIIGCLGATVNFIGLYSSIDPVLPASRFSNILRDYEARKILQAVNETRIISLKLSGFLFFGSTTLLLSRVRGFILGESDQQTSNGPTHRRGASTGSLNEANEKTPLIPPNDEVRTVLGVALKKRRSASYGDLQVPLSYNSISAPTDISEESSSPLIDVSTRPKSSSITEDDEIRRLEKLRSHGVENQFNSPQKVKFLVLDFDAVTNVDATAVSTGLLRIKMLAQAHNVKLVFCSLRPKFETLFRANNVLGAGTIVRPTLNDGLDFCETEILDEIKQRRESGDFAQSLNLLKNDRVLRYPNEPNVPDILFEDVTDDSYSISQKKRAEKRARASLALLVDTFFGWGRGKPSLSPEQSKRLASYFTLLPKRAGSVIFDYGDESELLFVVLSGEGVLYKPSEDWLSLSRRERILIINGTRPGTIFGKDRETIQRARYGSMIGDLSFTLQEKRAFGALAERDTALFALSRNKMKEMEISESDRLLAIGLQKMIGRSLGMTLTNLQQLGNDE